jgi:hypothetical protein
MLTKAGAPTNGTFQVETATVVGTITGSGNATVVVTAAGMAGSPITVPVAVLNTDTAAQVAGKIITALQANTVIAAFFTISSGGGATVVATTTVSAANDGTMNISVDNGTCTGLTAAPTSANTTAGVRGDYKGCENGTYCTDSSGFTIYQNTGDTKRPVWTSI